MTNVMRKLTAILMIASALAISINAAPTECLADHPNGYSRVNPYCAGGEYDRFGRCVLGHYYPCEVTVTEAYTGYHCSVHGNEFVPGEVHYERIVHIDGHGNTVIDEDCCDYN